MGFVMTGLDPAIHGFEAWMPGTNPGMTLAEIVCASSKEESRS